MEFVAEDDHSSHEEPLPTEAPRKSLAEQVLENENQQEQEFLEKYALKQSVRGKLSTSDIDFYLAEELKQRQQYLQAVADESLDIVKPKSHRPTEHKDISTTKTTSKLPGLSELIDIESPPTKKAKSYRLF
ncbi:hypothetical protein GEMRC1_008609 [Eukaryota sp. GEM-RC1]